MKNISIYTIQQVKAGNLKGEFDTSLSSPDIACDIFQQYLEGADREHFVVAALNTKNKITGIHTASMGSLNAAIVHPREVYKFAIVHNAAAIIVAHNHPSGDPSPSKEDIDITKRLVESGEILGIELLDHIIIGDNRYYSLREKGHM